MVLANNTICEQNGTNPICRAVSRKCRHHEQVCSNRVPGMLFMSRSIVCLCCNLSLVLFVTFSSRLVTRPRTEIAMGSNTPFACPVVLPGPRVPIGETPARWSYSNVDRPALHVTPDDEGHIIQALEHGHERRLTVVVAGGGNAAFVPITKDTLYLSLDKFDRLELNEGSQTVTFGGGVRAGRVLTYLAELRILHSPSEQ